jgi:hypothetical protein
MDNETLRLIARVKITAARAGLPVDVVRFASDRPYAKAVLQKVADAVEEDDVLLVLQLMEKLQMIAPVPREAVVLPMPGVPMPALRSERPVVEERYVGRLR